MSLFLENKIPENRAEFAQKVRQVSRALVINPDWLMLLMYHESRLNHRIFNSIGCVGLIQFCPFGFLQQYGITAAQLAQMRNVEQLNYVYAFFKPKAGKFKSYYDLHLWAFYPYALGKSDSYIFGSERGSAAVVASQNRPFDINRDGVITVREFKTYLSKYARELGYNGNFFASVEKGKQVGQILPGLFFLYALMESE